jgi:cation:H+ antiporter
VAVDLFWFVAGLAALVVGAEILIRAGSWLAAELGIPPILVGLTVVSIGTSMPELAIGIFSVADGNGSLAVGNIAGTNTLNLLFILGLSALLRPLSIAMRTVRFDLPAMTVAAVLMWLMAADGMLTRADGAVLVAIAGVYTAVVIWTSRRESLLINQEFVSEYTDVEDTPPEAARRRLLWRKSALLMAGMVVIVIGADWLVNGAVGIARDFGVSDAFIGLTVVAIGTSAPELVTTVISTIRNQRDIAIGNLLGSSIYNIVLILGITLLVPAHGVSVGPELVRVDIPVMVAVALACVPIFITGRRVSRLEGAAMVAAYFGYLAVVLQTQL